MASWAMRSAPTTSPASSAVRMGLCGWRLGERFHGEAPAAAAAGAVCVCVCVKGCASPYPVGTAPGGGREGIREAARLLQNEAPLLLPM